MTPEPNELRDIKIRLARAERRARVSGACALAALALTALLNLRPAALAQVPGVSLASLLARLAAVEQKTAPISISSGVGTNTELTFTGVNVHIVSGSGYTDDGLSETGGTTLTGLGNLIIGYDALRNNSNSPDVRTGSHNLILGDNNNYSSSGGLVAGQFNAVSGPYASVAGGFDNAASGRLASVAGGGQNVASGVVASVSGGNSNTASGFYASVSGGIDNAASGDYASVSGGEGLFESTVGGWSAGSEGGGPTVIGNFRSH